MVHLLYPSLSKCTSQCRSAVKPRPSWTPQQAMQPRCKGHNLGEGVGLMHAYCRLGFKPEVRKLVGVRAQYRP